MTEEARKPIHIMLLAKDKDKLQRYADKHFNSGGKAGGNITLAIAMLIRNIKEDRG